MTPPNSLITLATRFPLETVTILIGDRTWQITCVTDQDALLDGINDVEHVPYGFLLWESAVALAGWLTERADQVVGKRVLELGAGVGLAGLMADHLGAEVWQTDHHADVLLLAQQNAQQNDVALPHQFIADWRNWAQTAQYDLILGADILYERAMHQHLAPIFRASLAPGGTLVLSDPSRPQALELIAAMEDEGWRIGIEMRSTMLPLPGRINKLVDVALLTCQWP